MAKDNNVRFVRIRGRIVPIRNKGSKQSKASSATKLAAIGLVGSTAAAVGGNAAKIYGKGAFHDGMTKSMIGLSGGSMSMYEENVKLANRGQKFMKYGAKAKKFGMIGAGASATALVGLGAYRYFNRKKK